MTGSSAPVVALDAMGGDDAPTATVAGALLARERLGAAPLLVGDTELLAAALQDAGDPDGLPIVHAPDVVAMGEEPALALRAKPDASIRVGARLLAEGRADALVSAGSTGATLAASLLEVGRIEGVRRPVVGAVIPTPSGTPLVLVDAGASMDSQPAALVDAARMGVAYAIALDVAAPQVGLLNVGHEPGKGHSLAREAYPLLQAVEGFVGNTEPEVALGGAVQVLVTDGFTGNIFLKTVEAVARARGGLAEAPAAAALLGVAGCVLVAHGAAGPEEIASALITAEHAAAGGMVADVARRLATADTGGGS